MSRPTGKSLRARVLRAGLWSMVAFVLSMIIRFGSNLIMTRLLMPEMFGLMSLASTILVGLAMFSDLGLRQSVVQNERGNESSFLNTVWSIQILRGFGLWAAALLACVAISIAQAYSLFPAKSVYSAPNLSIVLAALSFSMVISGFTSTRLLQASRNMALAHVTRNEVASQVIGLIFMIAWVAIDRSVWALLAGALTSSTARVILSHCWLPGETNRLEWDKRAVADVVYLGKWIFFASVLGFLVNSGDQILIAGFVDSGVLGLYVIASLYLGAIDTILARIMSDVSFPTFSEIVRRGEGGLRKNYYRFHLVLAALSYFSSGFLIIFGRPLITLLYDERYWKAGTMIAILAPILLTVPFRLATQSFLALGKPELQSHVLTIRLTVLAAFVPLGFHFFGLYGALGGVVLSHFSYVPLIMYYNIRNGLFDWRREIFVLPVFPLGIITGSLVEKAVSAVVSLWH